VKTFSDTSKTILVITVGFLVIYAFKQWQWAFWTAIAIGGLSILSSYLAKKIAWLWLQLGNILGMIVPKIILSLIFFLILFPVALLSKIFGKKDTLQLKNTASSLFKTVNKTFDAASFEKPW